MLVLKKFDFGISIEMSNLRSPELKKICLQQNVCRCCVCEWKDVYIVSKSTDQWAEFYEIWQRNVYVYPGICLCINYIFLEGYMPLKS